MAYIYFFCGHTSGKSYPSLMHTAQISLPLISFVLQIQYFSVYQTLLNNIFSTQFLTQTLPFIVQFSSVQWLSHVQLFAPPWTAAHQAFLSITNSLSLLKLMSIELVMPSNHLILCRPPLLPSVFSSISIFSSESALQIR